MSKTSHPKQLPVPLGQLWDALPAGLRGFGAGLRTLQTRLRTSGSRLRSSRVGFRGFARGAGILEAWRHSDPNPRSLALSRPKAAPNPRSLAPSRPKAAPLQAAPRCARQLIALDGHALTDKRNGNTPSKPAPKPGPEARPSDRPKRWAKSRITKTRSHEERTSRNTYIF